MKHSQAVQVTILFALLLLLPGVQVAYLGWLHFVIPAIVLFYLYKWQNGGTYITLGLALAGIVGVILGLGQAVIFSAFLVPAGFTLAYSAFQSDSPAVSGCKGAATLGISWLVLLGGQILLFDTNPITQFLGALAQYSDATMAYYQGNDTIEPETLIMLEQSLKQLQTGLPKVMPALLLGLILMTVWFTMVSGNMVIKKFAGYRPWPNFQTWLLPDRLVWLLIGAVLLAVLPLGGARLIGVNGLIVLGIVYFFQGFSILVFFMHKWNVPLFLRVFLYCMVLIQSFGTMLVLIAGIGDVWLDMRRLKKKPPPPQNNM